MANKIVGLNPLSGVSKKTGNAFNAVMVNYVGEFRKTDTNAVGGRAAEVYVNRELFDEAAKGRALKDLLGKAVVLVYNSNGYLESVVIGE